MTFSAQPSLPERLPALRDDLRLHESAANPDGSPSWTIQDPVNNQFYRIGWVEFELLSRWPLGTPDALLQAAATETLLKPSADELLALLLFLQSHHLLAIHSHGYTDKLVEIYRRSKLSHATWLLHHYLFFRIPLWHPDRWLQRTLPWVSWVFRPATAYVVLALCVLGVVLTARQIDTFAASFVDTLSPGGLAGYLIALAFAKSLHELGHAFTATRHGVRVAHMGVAFLVMWPVLYTDTGESWRLRNRRQRLEIASAGILMELTLAGLATLAWNLTDPGDLRQALFFLATTAWLVSLGLNASPFMRFDGYFILSDILDIPNLHERSFAIARTWLRNTLLGWNDPEPESFSPARRRFLIGFGLATWMYRLVVFFGIGVAVYLLFFKLLGIFLFIVEIGWFIMRPLANEMKVWRERRAEIRPSRRHLAALTMGGLLLLGLIPWNMSVNAESWAHGEFSHVIYSPLPGRIIEMPVTAGVVAKDALLIALDQPESRLRARIASTGEGVLEQQLASLAGLPQGEEKRPALEQQLALKQAQTTAENDEANRLQLRAPFAGVLSDIDPELRPGVWVSPHQSLAMVIAAEPWTVEAFVDQHDMNRIAAGHSARFYPQDETLFPLTGEVLEIDRNRVAVLPHPLLSTRHGGNLPVLQDANGLTPRDALYRVRIRLDHAPERMAVRRGKTLIEAAPRSWLVEAAKTVLVVLIREASF